MSGDRDGSETDMYVIWSNEHRGWWGPGGVGYPKRLREAGQYTREHALEICANAIPGSHGGFFNEIPVRLADMRTFLKNRVVPVGLL